jgi:hypothetical protein
VPALKNGKTSGILRKISKRLLRGGQAIIHAERPVQSDLNFEKRPAAANPDQDLIWAAASS